MTATCTFSNFEAQSNIKARTTANGQSLSYQADIVDFDGETHSAVIEARCEAEAERQAQQIAQRMGIDASYICVYQY